MLVFLYPSLATAAFALLLTGFAFRKRGSLRHAWLMGAGMALDLALVLTLEFTRNAIATALGGKLTGPQLTHILASTLAVLLYFPVFALGFKRLHAPSSANEVLRTWHMRLGFMALSLRAVGFAFMFSIVGRTR
jgi:hypothetical protein